MTKTQNLLLFAVLCSFGGAIVSFILMPLYINAGLIHDHAFLAKPPAPPIMQAGVILWASIQVGYGFCVQWGLLLALRSKPWLSLLVCVLFSPWSLLALSHITVTGDRQPGMKEALNIAAQLSLFVGHWILSFVALRLLEKKKLIIE